MAKADIIVENGGPAPKVTPKKHLAQRIAMEKHPNRPQFHDNCGGAGMPCPDCNPMANDSQVELERRDDRRQVRRPRDQ